MTQRTRQDAEPICIHWDLQKYLIGRNCEKNVRPADVNHGLLANMTVGSLPCLGLCPEAKCAKKELEETKPETKPDPQGLLF